MVAWGGLNFIPVHNKYGELHSKDFFDRGIFLLQLRGLATYSLILKEGLESGDKGPT